MDAKIKKCMVGEMGSRTDAMRPRFPPDDLLVSTARWSIGTEPVLEG